MEANKLIEELYRCADELDASPETCREAVRAIVGLRNRVDDLEKELREERHRHDRYVDFELAQAEELRELREKTRWIPVTERLPEESGWCMGYIGGNCCSVFHYSAIHKAFNAFDGICNDSEVLCKYWMPLPELPKDGEDGN